MRASGRRHGLLFKTPQPIFAGRETDRQNVQRNFAMQSHIFRQVHFTHSARADLLADFVATEFWCRQRWSLLEITYQYDITVRHAAREGE